MVGGRGLNLFPAPTPRAFQHSWGLGTVHSRHRRWGAAFASSFKGRGNVCQHPCGVSLHRRAICSLACKMRGDSQPSWGTEAGGLTRSSASSEAVPAPSQTPAARQASANLQKPLCRDGRLGFEVLGLRSSPRHRGGVCFDSPGRCPNRQSDTFLQGPGRGLSQLQKSEKSARGQWVLSPWKL